MPAREITTANLVRMSKVMRAAYRPHVPIEEWCSQETLTRLGLGHLTARRPRRRGLFKAMHNAMRKA
jgi:hypothetical protein